MNRTSKRNAIVSALLVIALCVSLMAGATFALFTSESTVNIAVTSGKVKVTATAADPQITSLNGSTLPQTSAEVDGNTVRLQNLVPGDTVTFSITVTNESTVNVKYRTVIKKVSDDGLWAGLKVSINNTTYNGLTVYDSWADLAVGAHPATVTVTVSLPDTGDASVDNLYQGKACTFAYSVEAVQGNASTVDPYQIDENGVYHINDEAGMLLLNQLIDAFEPADGHEMHVSIDADMDMSAYTWEPINGFFVYLDGNGHTVKNLNCAANDLGRSGFVSYLGGGKIENITLENVTAVGAQAGVVAGLIEDGVINGLTVKGTNSVAYSAAANPDEEWGAVGAVAGYSHGLKDTENSILIADGATVSVDYTGLKTAASVYNDYAFGADMTDDISNGGTVTTSGTPSTGLSFVKTVEGLKTALHKGGNIVLAKDLTLTEAWESIKVDTASGYHPIADTITIDGNGHSISGLTMPLLAYNAARYITIVNLTIKNSEIGCGTTGNSYHSGAFLAGGDNTMRSLVMDNCHTESVEITAGRGSGSSAGSLVGHLYTHSTSEGGVTYPSKVEIKNCTVKGGSVTNSYGNAAGLVGMIANGSENDSYLIEGCTVENCTISGEEAAKTGALVGTVNNGGVLNINNCTYDDTAYKIIGRNTTSSGPMATVMVNGVSVTV